MNKEFKIYHTETQEDYDDLMIKLENEGCVWASGKKPTAQDHWHIRGKETVVHLHETDVYTMYFGCLRVAKEEYSEKNIIKHKAKGVERMEKVVVPQFVADWYENNRKYTIYGLVSAFVMASSGNNKRLTQWNELLGNGKAQGIIAKMHLYGYEAEEEKKYYWRKKKEYILEFETTVTSTYLNCSYITGNLMFSNWIQSKTYQTKFTETEVRELVSEEDFNKLEKVEIDE